MSLDLIADMIKNLKESMYSPPFGARHDVILVLEAMRIKIQEHEALLLYAHKTLDLDYHIRADEIHKKLVDAFEEDKEKAFLSHDERIVRIKRFGREAREARKKLDEKFNIGEKVEG